MDDNFTQVISVFCMQDAYAEPRNDTRNLAGFMLAVAVKDVQDMPPIFTTAPPVTILNNTLQKVSLLLLDNWLMRTALFWVITQRVVVISYRRFGTTCKVPFSRAKFLTREDA
jgi:hypothetical protein